MPVDIQTIAGAGQFTGLVGAGLITWDVADYAFLANENLTVGIFGYSYFTVAPKTDHQVDLTLQEDAVTTSERFQLEGGDSVADTNSFTELCSDGIPVPRDGGQIWRVVFVTVAKAEEASLIVWWNPMRIGA